MPLKWGLIGGRSLGLMALDFFFFFSSSFFEYSLNDGSGQLGSGKWGALQ